MVVGDTLDYVKLVSIVKKKASAAALTDSFHVIKNDVQPAYRMFQW
jgi:hypothetical protein